MIYLIVGANAYQAQQELQNLSKDLDLQPERIDPESLDFNRLADMVRGLSLFQEQRLIVMRQFSERKDLWDKLGEWAGDVAPETHLVLIERRPDKRTKLTRLCEKSPKQLKRSR